MPEWLNQRIFCSCAKCKGAIVCIRRITRQHITDHGLWETPYRRDSSADEDEDIEEAVRRTGVQTMPHYSVMSGCQRRQARVQQERLFGHGSQAQDDDVGSSEYNEAHQVDHMDEMMRDFFETDVPIGDESNIKGDEPHRSLLDAAKVPLYEGSQYSILRATLEILNLQTIYGWSSASVTSLLK